VREVPTDEEIRAENRDYFALFESGRSFAEIQEQRKRQKIRVFLQAISLIDQHLARPCSRILDLGCSYGSFLSTVKTCLSDCATYGIDLAPEYGDLLCSQGHHYHCGFFEEVSYDVKFDVITAFEVLEHVKHPGRVLEHAWGSLESDGLIILEVPNFKYHLVKGKVEKTLLFRLISGEDVWGLMPHVHLNFFTPRTLGLFLKDHGFKVVDCLTRESAGHMRRYPSVLTALNELWTGTSSALSRLRVYVGSAFIMAGRKQG
jgi:2-polyprenyl-3-methyl-5-hydroxy-6-metoxy-1,4-benzoquinol methylase